jgi:hypothetical protein
LSDGERGVAARRSKQHESGNDIWKIGSTYLNARTIAADLGDRELARSAAMNELHALA